MVQRPLLAGNIKCKGRERKEIGCLGAELITWMESKASARPSKEEMDDDDDDDILGIVSPVCHF
eukprot:scaffold181525_cov22-Tisochrysis_lutea.AAC.3